MKTSIHLGTESILLTNKESLFVSHYLGEAQMNATLAARMAGYSERTAGQQGYENLKKPDILKYITFKSKPLFDQLGITQERVLKELVAIAFGNVADFLEPDFKLKSLKEMDPNKTGAIKDIEKTDTGFKLRLHDKLAALNKVMEILKIESRAKEDSRSNFFNETTTY